MFLREQPLFLGLCRLLAQGSRGHGEEVGVEREGGIDQSDEEGEDVAHVDGSAVVLLGDLQGRRGDDLLPAQAHVRAEDDHSRQVEEHPAERLEDLELHAVDIAHVHRLASWGVNPEEVQPQLEQRRP